MAPHVTRAVFDPITGVALLTGDDDPTAAPGIQAVVGSLYVRRTGVSGAILYQKFGAGAAQWENLSAGGLSQASADLRYLQLAAGGTVSGATNFTGALTKGGVAVALSGDSYTKVTADGRFAPIGLTSIRTFDGGSDVSTGRQVDRPPDDYKLVVRAELKNRSDLSIPGAGTYAGMLTVGPWTDASAGSVIGQLAWAGDVVSWRSGTIGSAWSAWKSLAKVGDSYTTTTSDARYVKLDGSSALTGMLTFANVVNTAKLPNNTRFVSANTTGAQAGELILVAGDNGTYITLASGGFFNVRAGSQTTLLHIDESGYLTATADVTAFSDGRLKTAVKAMTGCLARVLGYNPVEFDRIDIGGHHAGFIAQQVRKVQPLAVREHDDEQRTLAVNLTPIVADLVGAIQEQQQQIDDLKQRLAALEARE